MPFTLKLLGVQEETFNAGLIITAYRIIDEKDQIVTFANTLEEAKRKLDKYRQLYPEHTFSILE